VVCCFSEVTGLEVNTEFEEIKEGGVNNFVHKLPKTTKYGNLVLKKGMTDNDTLYNWHQDVINGIINTEQIAIILTDRQKNELKRWTFQNAFPVKWTGPDLKADTSSFAIESVELAHQGLLWT
jgi:phage tail-like protein